MFALLVWCLCSWACYSIAKSKGRSEALWAVLGILFGVFAVLAIAILPENK